jgi:hypothetical protein
MILDLHSGHAQMGIKGMRQERVQLSELRPTTGDQMRCSSGTLKGAAQNNIKEWNGRPIPREASAPVMCCMWYTITPELFKNEYSAVRCTWDRQLLEQKL